MDGILTTADGTYDTLFPRQEPHIDPEFDITAMIDVVSLMNLYFLITFVTAISIEINLPAANHAAPLDADVATIITVVAGPDANNVVVYLGNGKSGTALSDPEDQTTQITAAVERGLAQGKKAVLIKAEKSIRLREMNRIAAAASQEGATLHIAIMEKDTES